MTDDHPYDRLRASVERDLRQRYPDAPDAYYRREAHRYARQMARFFLPDKPPLSRRR